MATAHNNNNNNNKKRKEKGLVDTHVISLQYGDEEIYTIYTFNTTFSLQTVSKSQARVIRFRKLCPPRYRSEPDASALLEGRLYRWGLLENEGNLRGKEEKEKKNPRIDSLFWGGAERRNER